MGSRHRASTCLATLLFVVACSAQLKHVEVDPSLSRASLVRDGIANLGCVSLAYGDSDFDRSNLLNAKFVSELRDAREDTRVVAWGDARELVGDILLRQCFESERKYGSLKSHELDSLEVKLRTRARYVVIHRITSSDVSSGSTDKTDESGATVGVDATTSLSVTAEFGVYDLHVRKRVWNGTIEGTKSNSQAYQVDPKEEDEDGDSGGVLGFIGSLFGIGGDDDDDSVTAVPSPDAPTIEKVMGSIYSEFADKLLKED